MSRLPLDRIKVIDLTRARAGPTAVRMLADWGAQVVKIETPGGTPEGVRRRHGFDFQNLHRNKRCITLDLKKPEGLEIFDRLVAGADVVVENYRPQVKHRLKVDYERLAAINPRLIYGSLSGFGQDGPYRDRPGVDQIAQGMGGLMSVTGLPGQGPVRVGIPIADLTSGIFLAMGIMMALFEREDSGLGQWVQTSLLEAQLTMLDFQAARWLIAGEVPGQAGNNHPTGIPTGVFKTSDGAINLAAAHDTYPRLARAMGSDRLMNDPAYATSADRLKNRDRLNAEIEEITKTKTSAEWVEILNAAGCPCGPIYTMDQAFADPQVRHLRMAEPVQHPVLGRLQLLRQAFRLSRTPAAMRNATAELGEHTDQVLRELGYDADAIARFRSAEAV